MWARRELLPAGLVLALAASVPAAGDELWRGPARAKECHVTLINEIGGVRVGTGSPADPAPVVSGSPKLKIEAATGHGLTMLTVTRRDDESPAGSGDVAFSVPPGCLAEVRTIGGLVEVEVGAEAFPLAVDTVTGDITARVDPATATTIIFATSGELTTDYTISIDFRYHEEPAKHGWISVGDHMTQMRLISRRGAISVLRPAVEPTSGDAPWP